MKIKKFEEIYEDKLPLTREFTSFQIENLKRIKDNIDKILLLKNNRSFNSLMDGDNAWVSDHISTCSDDIEEITNFIESRIKQGDGGLH